MKDINSINPEDFLESILTESASSVSQEESSMTAIAGILSLPDDLFEVISEAFISEYEKQLMDSNNRMLLAMSLEKEGVTSENYSELFNMIFESIDNELKDLPQNRKDFLKRIFILSGNAISNATDNALKNISIPIELYHKDAKIPTYANMTDDGVDIYALEDIQILPGETKLIKTGLKVAVPAGYELQVRPKSGVSLRTKLRVANTPGTIDSGYRDEIGIIIENVENPIQDISYHFDDDGKPIIDSIVHGRVFMIAKGKKFAQLVLNEVPHIIFHHVDNIGKIEGDRGGGFGSTGLK